MRKNLAILGAVVVAVSVLAFAKCMAKGGTKVAVVNMESLMKESTAAQQMSADLGAMQQAMQQEIFKADEILNAQESGLDKGKLTPADFAKKQKELSGKRKDLEARAARKTQELRQAAEGALQALQQGIHDVTTDYAKSNGVGLIAPQHIYIYVGDDVTDATADLRTMLDKKLPKIALNISDAQTN